VEELPAKPPFPPSAPHSRNRPRFHGERVARGGEHLHAGGGGAREGEVVSRVPRTGAGREGGFHREAQDFQRARGLRRGCGALVEDRRVRGKFQEEGRGAARDGHPGVQIRQFSRGLGRRGDVEDDHGVRGPLAFFGRVGSTAGLRSTFSFFVES